MSMQSLGALSFEVPYTIYHILYHKFSILYAIYYIPYTIDYRPSLGGLSFEDPPNQGSTRNGTGRWASDRAQLRPKLPGEHVALQEGLKPGRGQRAQFRA